MKFITLTFLTLIAALVAFTAADQVPEDDSKPVKYAMSAFAIADDADEIKWTCNDDKCMKICNCLTYHYGWCEIEEQCWHKLCGCICSNKERP